MQSLPDEYYQSGTCMTPPPAVQPATPAKVVSIKLAPVLFTPNRAQRRSAAKMQRRKQAKGA